RGAMLKHAILSTLLTLSMALGLPCLSYAADVTSYPAGAAANGIAGTRHNMGAYGKVITTRATTEICVFCHTPHHANKGGTNGLAPLWNKGTAAPTSFTAYGSTLGNTSILNTDIGGATLACLSCHDGVTTFDNIVNAPGKDGVIAGGSNLNWGFDMPGTPLPPLGWTQIDHFFTTGGLNCGTCHITEDRSQNVTRLIIGTDLSNDHPVSVAYNSDRASLRATDTVINSIDLTSELASSAVSYSNGNLAQNRWAVKGFISASARISDVLRNGRVECSSCHDPHFDNLSWDEVESTWADGLRTSWCNDVGEDCSDGNFLRRIGGNTGSGVCRTCHNK
ncbi:MAG: hypothetical protein NUW09_01690, partial [Deltaproteobacteria bacterium]|nr:hypothetical protein [Deltaproteobacteria bacterium]